MKKLISVFCAFTLLFSMNVFAYGAEVPGQMPPNSVIEFDENLNIQIINPGNATFRKATHPIYNPLNFETISEEQKREYEKEQQIFKEASELSKILPVTRIKIIPEPGMRVVYDGEGFVDEVIYANRLLSSYKPLKRGTTSPVGTYTWGKHNNTLVVTEKHVTGTGRFTVFTDKTGENGNTLQKDDCATRGDYDNPDHGQAIQTRKLNADLTNTECTHTFYKRDNGALPDAILDIWKDGVEGLGESYSSSLSFMGRYFYETPKKEN